jgi:hypothetical protein
MDAENNSAVGVDAPVSNLTQRTAEEGDAAEEPVATEQTTPDTEAPAPTKLPDDPYGFWGRKARERTQVDYYPNSNNGQYHTPTGSVKFATYGEVPARIWGQQLQDIKEQKAKLNQAVASFDPNAGLDAVPEPYQKSFNGLVDRTQTDFMGKLAAQYGGNMREAERARATDPHVQQQWAKINRDLNEVGHFAKYKFGMMQQTLTDMERGQLRYDAKLKKKSEDVLQGLGQYQSGDIGDIQKLRSDTEEVSRLMSFQHVMEAPVGGPAGKTGGKSLSDHILAHIATVDTEMKITPNHGILVTSYDKVKGSEAAIDRLAEELFNQQFSDWDGGLPAFKQKMHDYFPVSVEHEVKTSSMPSSSGGGPSDFEKKSRIVYGRSTYDDRTANLPVGDGALRTLPTTFDAISLKRADMRYVNPSTFKRGIGDEQASYIPESLVRDQRTGTFYVAARRSDTTTTQNSGDASVTGNVNITSVPDATGKGASAWTTDKQTAKSDTQVKQQPLEYIPLDGNEGFLTTALGGDERWRDFVKEFGVPSRKESKAFVDPTKTYKVGDDPLKLD